MYEFEKTVESITTKLGDNSTLVSAELKEILSEVNSVTSRLKEVNSESANRRVEIKTLKDDHAKQIESFSDYESLKDQLGKLQTNLNESQGELKTVYDGKKSKLKELYSQFDFEDDKLKSISARFKGVEAIESLTNSEVNSELGNFELLSVNKIETSGKVPNPSREQNKKTVHKYSYMNKEK
jgi:chromosome segregation ATPase